MNILLIGSGGRECALAWKMHQSPQCTSLFIAPGNGGTQQYGTNVALDILDFNQVLDFIIQQHIQMVVVGPEVPLVKGITDVIKSNKRTSSVIVVGPGSEGAQLEGSKAFSKVFMEEFGIPTAAYKQYNAAQLQAAQQYILQQRPPIVLKADGLAAGKGVLICASHEEAMDEIRGMFEGKFGAAGDVVVIEEFLDGIEFSVFVLTDGQQYFTFPIAKDYKRIGEGDTGLNTGGMGAISPVAFVDDVLMKKVDERIIQPTIRGIRERQMQYKGFIFFGLIKVNDEPYVIEYNCRLGDPETEVVIPRLKNDLLDLFVAMDKGDLNTHSTILETDYATTVMLVSEGYPGSYEKGKEMLIPEELKGIVFHAGTQQKGDKLLSNGGRVIACTGMGKTMEDALDMSNSMAEDIQFEGKKYRMDIGFDLSE